MLKSEKNKYSNSRVAWKKNSKRKKNPYPPPTLQVKWSVPKWIIIETETKLILVVYTYMINHFPSVLQAIKSGGIKLM